MTSGWRRTTFLCVAAVALLVPAGLSFRSAAAAQQSQDRTWCHGSQSTADQKIAGCTALIQSGRESRQALFHDYWARGDAYSNKGDYERAIPDYTEAIRIDPKDISPLIQRGTAYSGKGDYDRAITDYDKALDLCRLHYGCTQYGQVAAYFHRGWAYYDKKDYDRAIADQTEAIRLAPKDQFAFNGRGLAYYAKGDYERAIADYSQAIWFDPKFAIAYKNRGLAYYARGDYDRAIADYSEAIRLDPKYTLAYINRGNANSAKGDYGRAIPDWTELIRLNPKSAFAYFNRGIANLYAGALPKAVADLTQASGLSPKYPYAALWLDIVDKRSNLPSRLAQAISQLDMTKWPAPVIRLYLGQMTPEAVLAAADDPKSETKKGQVCEANFYTGELAVQRGAKDEAARLFRLAAADCPKGFTEFDAANAELKALGVTP